MLIRKARAEDYQILSELAFTSKAYWGYSQDFMEKCRDDLTVTPEYIEENPVYVLELDNRIAAYYSLSLISAKLEALFIDPVFIGKGIGQLLWEDVMQRALQLGVKEFTLDSDPHAEGFYLKMGTKRVGEVRSTVFPDRVLPLMSVKVE